ncbi:unnamed protein product [Owenia fusiformis]|uniref:ABC-type glutathione-S-conjugate transporter n=1 Tax=Owenia fusiformis TaxID=6347 RepID=A0A8S4PGM3_OWEFU|nr:unnamed protein product [Owenia fusiformis]
MADENGNTWWDPVCGSRDFNNDSDTWAFWSFQKTVNATDPDFTRCFQQSVISWSPSVWLVICSLFYIPYLVFRQTVNKSIGHHSGLNIIKTVISLFLCYVSILDLIKSLAETVEGLPPRVIYYITPTVNVFTFALATFVIYYEFAKGCHSSGVVFIFWFLQLLVGVVPFRTNILLALSEGKITDSYRFVTFYIMYACVIAQFLLNMTADASANPQIKACRTQKRQNKDAVVDAKECLGESDKSDKIPCPELEAPFVSRLTYWWITGLIIRGYKKSLELKDLWELNFADTSASIWAVFGKHWGTEMERYRKATSLVRNYKYPVQKQITAPPKDKQQADAKEEDIPSAKNDEPSEDIMKAFNTGSLLKAITKTFGAEYMLAGFFKLLSDASGFLSPQILNLLIGFVNGGDPLIWKGYIYAVSLFAIAVFQSIILQQYSHGCFSIGLKVRSAIVAAVYRKALTLNNTAKKSSTVGEIVNLMAVDSQKLLEAPPFIHMIWSAPITIAFALYFLWQQLGPSVLAGLGVTVIMIPINAVLAGKIRDFQIRQMKLKDGRIKLMNEVLSGMKVLKLYAWEGAFQEKILEIRNQEIAVLRASQLFQAVSSLSWFCAPFLVALASFATYVSVSETNILTAQRAFVSLSLFNIMNAPLAQIPAVITYLVQCAVSIGRLSRFLKNPELDVENVKLETNQENAMSIRDGTFSWDKDDAPVLHDVNMRIPEGKLVAVVGMVGCGKSSLISALLGDMEVMKGSISLRGSVAYVPQQAWIQFNTLKNNIIFGAPLDDERYEDIIKETTLKTDLEILQGGDQTEIGEKGINLSGGQKQRVSLARAVYQNKDIYLLDDPLSAVDAHVGKHIFDNVIGPAGILRNKTRVLVTNGINFLPKCDEIIVLNNGTISETGTFAQLLKNAGAFSEYIATYLNDDVRENEIDEDDEMIQIKRDLKRLVSVQSALSDKSDKDDAGSLADSIASGKRGSMRKRSSPRKRTISTKSDKLANEDDVEIVKKPGKKEKLVEDEMAQEGGVRAIVFLKYFKACGVGFCILTVLATILYMGCQVGTNIWLNIWSSDKPLQKNGTLVQDKPLTNLRLGIYGTFGAGSVLTVLLRSISIALASTFYTPISSITWSGLQCLSSTQLLLDVDTLDINIPITIKIALFTLSSVIMTVVVIIYITPLFVVVIIPLAVFYYFVQRFYVATSRQLKRLESISRSPIYSHFSETVVGASSIRAYGKQDEFVNKSDVLVNQNQQAYYPNIVSNRWLGILLEFIGNIIVLFAGLFAVIGRDTLSGGQIGLSVSYSLQVTQSLNILVRMLTDLETHIVSVERIKEYTDIENEAVWEIENSKPPPAWPQEGAIAVDNYSVRYREGLDLVLKDVSFNVQPGEKVGIVGRTGAGKSSLTLALFRILEPANGSIIIDGKDITKMGLHSLRSKLTIIPQEPVLFSGSLRMNLDPTDIRTDDELWGALENAHLKDYVAGLPEKLMHPCSEGGENLSVGQRQLVCLARALLRKTRILILDEATAAVDLETDDLIQNTIRTEFKDSTVVTIAHRLNTIIDYDRILVLDAGMRKEYETPTALLNDKTTIFYGMAKDAGLVS